MIDPVQKKLLSNRRDHQRRIQHIVEDYDTWVDEELLDEGNNDNTRRGLNDKANKYAMLLAPAIMGSFYRQTMYGDLGTRIRVNNTVNGLINDYESLFASILTASIGLINETSVDPEAYVELREKGATTAEALQIADTSEIKNYAQLSERQLELALQNREAQIQATADYDYMTNLTDDNGDKLVQRKRWDWSELENTRHSLMDGDIVDVDEPFQVYNEVTGETEEGMFPSRPTIKPKQQLQLPMRMHTPQRVQ